MTVCGSLGIDTSGYSIPYLAAWSENAELEAMEPAAAMIDRIARRIEGAVDTSTEQRFAAGGGRRVSRRESRQVKRPRATALMSDQLPAGSPAGSASAVALSAPSRTPDPDDRAGHRNCPADPRRIRPAGLRGGAAQGAPVRGEETTFDRLLTTVYYSLLVYLLPAVTVAVLAALGVLGRPELEQFFRGESPLWLTGLIAAVVLLVLPALAAVAAWSWMDSDARRRFYDLSDRLNAEHRTRTSWDFAFDHEQDLLLVVELKDGSRVAGYYGKRSHSGYGTKMRDLFLEERWDISADDGSITRPPPSDTAWGYGSTPMRFA